MTYRFSAETLGRCFIDDEGVIWEHITYTDQPTASFRRAVDHSQRLSGVIGSNLLGSLKPLSKSDEEWFRLGLEGRS